MSVIARFISPSKIKADTIVDENVDDKVLSNSIIYCQEEYTKSILGTALYDEIYAEIAAGSLSAVNTTLLTTYIQPALKWWVIYEAMEELWAKIGNKSVSTKTSDNSSPVNLDEILMFKNKYRDRAERMDQKTRLYLIQNSTTFPLYNNPGNDIDTIHPKGLTYGTGWYLGGTCNVPNGVDIFIDPTSCA